MKIFITGSTGFVGKRLKEIFMSKNFEVTAPNSSECDLLNQSSLNQFNDKNFDKIFHLASWTEAGDFCKKFQGDQWIINQKINTSVLEWWKNNQPQAKLISIGTSTSYDPRLPMIEENYLEGSPIETFYSYAMTKRMLEVGLRTISNQFNINYITLVPSTIYGPNYHNDGRQMHFIFDLVKKIILGKKKNQKVILWGDGFQKREVVFIDDFIQSMIFLEKECNNDLINICAGKEYTIRKFAEIICSLVDYDHEKIVYDTNQYVGARSKNPPINKLLEYIPSYIDDATALEIGLKHVIDWFHSQKNL